MLGNGPLGGGCARGQSLGILWVVRRDVPALALGISDSRSRVRNESDKREKERDGMGNRAGAGNPQREHRASKSLPREVVAAAVGNRVGTLCGDRAAGQAKRLLAAVRIVRLTLGITARAPLS